MEKDEELISVECEPEQEYEGNRPDQEGGVEEDRPEHGRWVIKKITDPKLPTESEVQEHYLSGTCPTAVGAIIASGAEVAKETIDDEAIKNRDYRNTILTTASRVTSSTIG